MIFQEPMTALNPLHTVERQIGEIIEIRQSLLPDKRRQRVIELLKMVEISDPEKSPRQFSASTFRWTKATCNDRHGDCQQPQIADSR